MRFMSRAAGGLMAVLAMLALAACSRKDADSRQVVTFWAMGREAEVVGQFLPEFERSHPGIRVDLQQIPWTAAHEKLLTAFAGDTLPDVCQLGNTWIPEFALLGTLTPREKKVLQLRFGLEDGRSRTLEEVGQVFGVTRERIRQIEAKALRKLRHPSRSKKLKDYLD